MDFGLGQRYGYAEDAALAIGRDVDGYPHGAIDPLASLAHPLVARIEQEIGGFVERPLAPVPSPASSFSAARQTWVEKIEASGPRSLIRMSQTLRVETPWTCTSRPGRGQAPVRCASPAPGRTARSLSDLTRSAAKCG